MSITIQTRLDAGIYKSEGGGAIRTHYTFSTGPRNLLKAIGVLARHKEEMERSYGNIGCGGSWLEIDGLRMDLSALEDAARDEREFYPPDLADRIKTRTRKAMELIDKARAELAAGSGGAGHGR